MPRDPHRLGRTGQPPSAGLCGAAGSGDSSTESSPESRSIGSRRSRSSRAEDVLATPQHPAIQPETLDDQDVVIRVPIATARVATDRLLGDEIVVWLRRDGPRFRIYRPLEDFQLQ